MGVENEMVHLLPQIIDPFGIMNPWVREIPEIFRGLHLKPGQIVLDIPCGKGGVSVPLAKKYGVTVFGYDIVEGFVKQAVALAHQQEVSQFCHFEVKALQEIVRHKNICDVLLWIAPPHLWKTSRVTLKQLRNCVKNGGIVFVADAYLYRPSKMFENYETLDAMNDGFTFFGDTLLQFVDYKDSLWAEDYQRTRKAALRTLRKLHHEKDKRIIERYLLSLDKAERLDTKHLGLGIWVLRVTP